MRDKIDGVLIDPDENGFHLILSGEEREYNFTLDASAVATLLHAVKTEIEPWWTEADLVRRGRVAVSTEYSPISGAYPSDDPKSEGYHDRMSAIWDDREK